MFDSTELSRVAQLARLALTEEERELFARQLADVLAYARQIQAVETPDVGPTPHPAGVVTPLRDDVVRPGLPRETALAQAPDPDPDAGLFKVPRVLG